MSVESSASSSAVKGEPMPKVHRAKKSDSKENMEKKRKVNVNSASKPEEENLEEKEKVDGNSTSQPEKENLEEKEKVDGNSTSQPEEKNLEEKEKVDGNSTSQPNVKGGQTPGNNQGDPTLSTWDSEGKPTGKSAESSAITSAVKMKPKPKDYRAKYSNYEKNLEEKGRLDCNSESKPEVIGGQTPENYQGEQPPSFGDSEGNLPGKYGKSPASTSPVTSDLRPEDHRAKEPDSGENLEEKERADANSASTLDAKGKQIPGSYQGELSPSTGDSENKPRKTRVEDSDPNIQQDKKITVSKELILFIIMTSTIIATMAALVPVLYLWSDNYKVNQELQQLQTQLADVNKRCEMPDHVGSDKDDDVSDLAAEMWKTKERLKAAEIKLGQCINTTSDFVKGIHQSYAKWFPIIGTGLIVELFMVVFVVYLHSKLANLHYEPHIGYVNQEHPRRQNGAIDVPQTQDKTHNKTDEFQGMKWVLSRIKGKKLHNKVCVISFYQEMSEKHVQLTRSAMESVKNVEIEPVVINNHAEILEIPACKIFIIYVDYHVDQRDVILKDTKKVLGDLLTTASAIQKFNADLILVYAGDKESGELRAEDLYNTDITSEQLDPDVKEISHKKRFLSTYKQFTTFQKEHISKILEAKLL